LEEGNLVSMKSYNPFSGASITILKKSHIRFTLLILLPLLMISQIHCSLFEANKREVPKVGYKLLVDYPDNKEMYILPVELVTTNELLDILAGFSLQQDPSIRFVTTSQSIEVMDVLGTRNNYQYAWRLYVDYKEVSPTDLKKSKPIQLNQIIQLKYLPARKKLIP